MAKSRRVRHGFVRASLTHSLIALTALAGALYPAHAVLKVSTEAPRAALWQQLYDHMPTWWKSKHTVVLREVTDEEMDRLVAEDQHRSPSSLQDDDSVVDGYYQCAGDDGSIPVITLRRTLRADAAELVFTHEYGHFVWDEKLTADERGEYRRLWVHQRRAHHLVTEYAADSPEEGFAEAYAYFIRRPAILERRDEDSYKYFQTVTDRLRTAQGTATKDH